MKLINKNVITTPLCGFMQNVFDKNYLLSRWTIKLLERISNLDTGNLAEKIVNENGLTVSSSMDRFLIFKLFTSTFFFNIPFVYNFQSYLGNFTKRRRDKNVTYCCLIFNNLPSSNNKLV